MKTAQQIIGLPVVSIFDGNEIGKVKNVIINASKGTIDFFVIDSGIRSLSGGVIPADRVLGIGEYALTIQQPDDISDIVKIPAAIELMQKNIKVSGTRVLTKKGNLLGETGDFYINDEGSYNITGVEFIPVNESLPSGVIPRSSIITFGKDLLVVQDDVISKLIELSHPIEESSEQKKNFSIIKDFTSQNDIAYSEANSHEISQELSDKPVEEIIEEAEEETREPKTETEEPEVVIEGPAAETEEPVVETEEPAVETGESGVEIEQPVAGTEELVEETEEPVAETEEPEVVIEGPAAETEEPGTETEKPEAETKEPEIEIPAEAPAEEKVIDEKTLSAAELFERRQRQYLVGKKVTKTIYAPDGRVLVNNGEIITNRLIDEVKAHGKLIELIMNYEE